MTTPIYGFPTPAGSEVASGDYAIIDLSNKVEAALGPKSATGKHEHTENVKKAGDTMTGQLGLVAPTGVNNAARWADGLPRFDTVAARDSAYASIGGAAKGMRCYVEGRIEWFGADSQWHYGYATGVRWDGTITVQPSTTTQLAFSAIEAHPSPLLDTMSWNASGIIAPVTGVYHMEASTVMSGTVSGSVWYTSVSINGGSVAISHALLSTLGLTAATVSHMGFCNAGDSIGTLYSTTHTATLRAAALRVYGPFFGGA